MMRSHTRATCSLHVAKTGYFKSSWAKALYRSATLSGAIAIGLASSFATPCSANAAESIRLIRADTDGWSRWRGALGDGHVTGLPKKWSEPEKLWSHSLDSNGVGGVAATEDLVVVSSRDIQDQSDVFKVLDAETGLELIALKYSAVANLDYGNSPRATPLITETHIYCLGALGHLNCIDIETMKVVWTKHLVKDLGGKLPIWGYASSPLLVDGKLIVQPGGLESGWVALNPDDGSVLWKTPGRAVAYSSSIVAEIGGIRQFINYDATSLGGWSVATGERLWELIPETPRDFNVPTPVVVDDRLFLVTENNGARTYEFANGQLSKGPQQTAHSDELTGDSHSPVRVGSYVVGVDSGMVVLDPSKELSVHARHSDKALEKYVTFMVEEDRLLATCGDGTVLMFRVDAQGVHELGRFDSTQEPGEILAHSAMCDGVFYVRGPKSVTAFRWGE